MNLNRKIRDAQEENHHSPSKLKPKTSLRGFLYAPLRKDAEVRAAHNVTLKGGSWRGSQIAG